MADAETRIDPMGEGVTAVEVLLNDGEICNRALNATMAVLEGDESRVTPGFPESGRVFLNELRALVKDKKFSLNHLATVVGFWREWHSTLSDDAMKAALSEVEAELSVDGVTPTLIGGFEASPVRPEEQR